MTEKIKFAGEQGNLTMEVQRYERPGTEDQDDANWLRCTLTIKAGPFSGMFNSAFTTYDLFALRDQLKNGLATLSGIASFQNTENDIEFSIEFNKRGAAAIRGTAQPHRYLGASLRFLFDTDQSGLAQTLRQLEAVLRKFPVKADGADMNR